MDTFITAFIRAWIGSTEYHEAWYKRSRTWSFPIRFWGRLTIAAAGLCFFLWQQITHSPQGSDTFATLVLAITVSQAAGPCFYLLYQWTVRFFLTRHYLEALAWGRMYLTLKSALCILLMTVLSVLAASGGLGTRWYMKLFVFLLTVPVACFFVFLPALNWVGVRLIGFPKAVLEQEKQEAAKPGHATGSRDVL
jgi:hypothetical protein